MGIKGADLKDEFLLCRFAAFSVAMMKRNATDCYVFVRTVIGKHVSL